MNIIITGASGGIGRETVKLLCHRAKSIGAIARRREKLEELKDELGDSVFPIELDLTNFEETQKVLTNHIAETGPVDVLINNAGCALGTEAFAEGDLTEWRRMIDLNCTALVAATRAVIPHMQNRKSGLIVNVGSVAGTYAYPGGNIYGATKAFVRQLSNNLRADLHGSNVRVSCIEPGTVAETDFSLVRFRGDSEAAESVYSGWQPLTSLDIAKQIQWLVELPPHINISVLESMSVQQTPMGFHFDKPRKSNRQ